MADNTKDYKLKVKLDLSQLDKDVKQIPKRLEAAQARIGVMLDKEIKQRRIINRLTERQTDLLNRQRGGPRAGPGAGRGRATPRAATAGTAAVRQSSGPIKAKETFGADLDYQQSRLRRMTPTTDAERGTIGSLMGESQRIQQQLATATTVRQVRRLRNEYSEVNKQISQVLAQQRRFNREIERANRSGNRLQRTMGRVAVQLGSVYAVIRAGGAVFRIGTEMDQMQAALLAASDTAEGAQKNFQFLRETSLELGKDIQTMTGGFNRIGVAMQAAGFQGEEIKEVFLAAAESATAFGLSNQRTEMTLLAMSQIVSKGRVDTLAPSASNGCSKPI